MIGRSESEGRRPEEGNEDDQYEKAMDSEGRAQHPGRVPDEGQRAGPDPSTGLGPPLMSSSHIDQES